MRSIATALLAPFAAGWLASSSCSVAACYEDCDPCWQTCHCSNTCHNPVAGEAGLRIVATESRILEDDAARFVRTIAVAFGPVLPAADDDDGGDPPDAQRVASFAQRVLAANSALFTAQPEPAWRLEAVERFPTGTVVQFALPHARFERRSAVSVALLLDARGRLIEATHVVDRTPH